MQSSSHSAASLASGPRVFVIVDGATSLFESFESWKRRGPLAVPAIVVPENAPPPLARGFIAQNHFDRGLKCGQASLNSASVSPPPSSEDSGFDSGASAALSMERSSSFHKANTQTPFLKGGRPKDEAQWLANFKTLCAFKEIHGHSNVPYRYEDKHLAQWVKNQRALFRKSHLAEDRIAQLKSIEFAWSARSSVSVQFGARPSRVKHVGGRSSRTELELGELEVDSDDWSPLDDEFPL